jgi:deferrochelatase/peroxidase EfeB
MTKDPLMAADPRRSDRRTFLAGAGAAALAATTGLGCTRASGADSASDRSADAGPGADGGQAPNAPLPVRFPYRGPHQAGITAPAAAAGVMAGFDVRAGDRRELADVLARVGRSIEQVMSGQPYQQRPGGFPPLDTGILGDDNAPAGISVIVGYGHSLFDERFGLAERRPLELQPMPKFANDFLVQAERSHGDLSIVVNADSHDAAVHAFRQITREARGDLTPRWMREGFNTLAAPDTPGVAPGRNLMGFKDGTANLDVRDPALLADQVWVGADDGQPAWAVGGSYQVLRVIRMMVEFWDRTRLNEQEAIFGRNRTTGAPLGGVHETDTPNFSVADPGLESHIARANPRTEGSERNLILRRGFNYAGGFDDNDQLDQGLLFSSYQRSLEAGFITVQRRLDGEALEEYIRPLGGGFFFAPRPPAEGEELGQALLA